VIALDDLHHVDDAVAMAFVDGLLARLPERWTLAATTRRQPALRLARLRASGLLTELRSADLQFTRDEAMALLLPAGLDEAAAEALHRRTMGWPAGLRLALVGARGDQAGGAIDRQAFDFLTAEVLAQLEPALREFLLQTSVLRELDAPRCEALTGDPHAWAHLDALERLDLFVTVVGDQPRTLRLHDLFRDALLHRLRVERPLDHGRLLVRAAAHESDLVHRQALLLAAGRADEAAALLRASSLRALFEGGVHTVVRLVEQFAPDFARGSADLQDVAGNAKWRLWRNAEAAQHLEAAEALHRDRGDEAAARLSALRRAAMLAGIGRPQAARQLLEQHARTRPSTRSRRTSRSGCASCGSRSRRGRCRSVAPRLDALLDVLEQARQPEQWAVMVPSPRLTACPGVGPQLLRWADGVSLAEAESPLLLSALAPMTRGWQVAVGRTARRGRALPAAQRGRRALGRPPAHRAQPPPGLHRRRADGAGPPRGGAGGGACARRRVSGQLRRPRPLVCA
jgi:LuxR family transcriptional regulator, maltose regulon positive regulatory protein